MKSVVLARPHPFIAAEMRPFLEHLGFMVKKPEAVTDLDVLLAGASGAVISLAISSSIPETAEEVVSRVRLRAPRMPLLIASMMTLANATRALEKVQSRLGVDAVIIDPSLASANTTPLGRPSTLLYLSKDDLSGPDRRSRSAKAIASHFR